MKEATNRDRGVSTKTSSATQTLAMSMNTKVPTMVTMPVNSWVKPWSRPSETWSMSLTTRLMKSPWAVWSMYRRGTPFNFWNSWIRRSFTVR